MNNRRMNAKLPRIVAEQILWLRSDRPTTPMHAIKLVYLCHGWMLGVFGRKLITEPVEAWRYGPVVPSVYHTYKSFGGGPIETIPTDQSTDFDAEQMSLIDAVLGAYKDYSAWDLSSITHQPGTPWDQVYRGGLGEGSIIPDRVIKKHYEARVKGAD